MANARLVSSEAMAPLAMVAHTGTAYSMPGRLWSDVYMATPLTLSGPSTLGSPAFVLGGRLSVDAMDKSPRVPLRGGERESVGYAAFGQLHLEAVFALWLCAVQSRFGGLTEYLLIGRLAVQSSLCLERPPGLGAYAPQGDTDKIQLAAVDHGDDGRRRQGEFIGGAVTQLEIDLLAARLWGRQGDKGDELARLQDS